MSLFLALQDHANTGAIALLFDIATPPRRLTDVNVMESDKSRLGKTMNYYSNILTNATAMAEYKEAAHSALPDDHRGLVVQTITRQTVNLKKCQFLNNTYGTTKQQGTNSGVITMTAPSNDVSVDECIFKDNQFGDANIVVRYLLAGRESCDKLPSALYIR